MRLLMGRTFFIIISMEVEMKNRLFCLLLAALVMFSLTACFSANEDLNAESDAAENSKSMSESKDGTKTESTSYEIIENFNTTGTNSIGTFWMQGVVVVENTGTTDLFLSSGSFDIEDASGHLVASESYVKAYPQVIAPGEKAVYYAEFSLENGETGESYSILPHLEIEEAKVPVVRFAVSDVTLSQDEYGYLLMTGRVENTSDKEESLYPVVAILYDKDERVLCLMYTYPDELAVGDKRGFEISSLGSYVDIKLSDVARYELFAYPEQYQF